MRLCCVQWRILCWKTKFNMNIDKVILISMMNKSNALLVLFLSLFSFEVMKKRQQRRISVNPILFVIQIDNPLRWIESVTIVVESLWDIVHFFLVQFKSVRSFGVYKMQASTLLYQYVAAHYWFLNSTGVYMFSMSLNTISVWHLALLSIQ